MFSFVTSGESHGQAILAIVSGLPSGLEVDLDFINGELAARQMGFGRGGRMKIEKDAAKVLSGVRFGKTIGSPVTLMIENRDWVNWQEAMAVERAPADEAKTRAVGRPRPGHADLAGALKYNTTDVRNILERASARETAARVAAGALARLFLQKFETEIASHTVAVGPVSLGNCAPTWEQVQSIRRSPDSPLRCVDREAEQRMIEAIQAAAAKGDTLGGCFEVVVHNLVVGLGSHISWETRLDGQLAQALMSMQAVKAVEIGDGMQSAAKPGSQVHDEIIYDATQHQFARSSNRSGGIEGGISNGEEIRVRGYLKPLSTLKKPLKSVDVSTKETKEAAFERSDVCVVPAAGIIGEAMVGLVLTKCFLEKFGGDSMAETRRNFEGYLEQIKKF